MNKNLVLSIQILRRIGWCLGILTLAVVLAPFIQLRTGDSVLY